MNILVEHPTKNGNNSSEVAAVSGQPTRLLDLPIELLQKIISNLPVSTIPNFMVNRFLLPICEQRLYETIMLWGLPRRTLRLLETFILRPDLALLVRHLTVEVSWANGSGECHDEVPDVLKADGVEALSLAKNIVSLTVDGFGDWMKAPAFSRFRDLLSNLKLTSLTIPWVPDPTYDLESLGSLEYEEEDREQEIVAEIRAVLQTQPRLEDLFFPSSYLSERILSILESDLLPSDVPNLKSLQADPRVAISFLAVSPGLESLTLFNTSWGDGLFFKLKVGSATIRSSLRRLAIRVWSSDEWFWVNLDKVFALFPNMETLYLAVDATTPYRSVQPAKYFFEKIVDPSRLLRSLQSIEFEYSSLLKGLSEVGMESVVALKTKCPHLKTIITPKNQMWLFQHGQEPSTDSVPTLVGPISLRWSQPESLFTDLPPLDER
ncbi:hypothetical protein FS837_006737 [Tulasnella sp. UAMH 9824]|nr:hypothetical protein FS837_006737 [Tulasnella sp. UAMH 9824]